MTMPPTKRLLCTLGPSSMNKAVISRLDSLGVSLFRVNLSHTPLADVERVIREVQALTSVPLSLDTEGAQIRTGKLAAGSVELDENTIVHAHASPVDGTAEHFNFYPEDVVDRLVVGDLISIDFDAVLVHVIAVEPGRARMRVLNGGRMGSNKAVSVLNRDFELPPLTTKDRQALKIGADMGLVNAALSFANRAEDVADLRAAFRQDGLIISKIECRNGIQNLDEILEASDGVLIDRGDLSREFPIEQIPALQKQIIARCKTKDVPVYIATNLLESMVSARTPTRAEVNDIFNTLIDGADGLVLAAETAIGKYPVRCAEMVLRMIREAQRTEPDTPYSVDATSGLVEPHGGRLINRVARPSDIDGLAGLPRLTVDDKELMDCEQIAVGTYSPLTGFMNRDAFDSVLSRNALPSGVIWTLPIVLQVPKSDLRRLGLQDRVVLEDRHGEACAVLDVSDIFEIDLDDVAKKWFGTTSQAHPGVARLYALGSTVVGGDVTLLRMLPAPYRHAAFTPAQTRHIFRHKGWSRVVAFHTRNVAHKVHEHLQLRALDETHADGLYINPVTGAKKPGDFLTEPILESYQLLIDQGVFPKSKILLGSFLTYSRYSGPREAVFTALCRKNMGCSHFIVGRDHTGVSDFYAADANRRCFDEIGDLGIKPVFFEALGYNPETSAYEEVNGKTRVASISGTRVRETLGAGNRLPDWFIRPAVQDLLLGRLASGEPLFHG